MMARLGAHSGARVFLNKGVKLVGVLNRPAGPETRRFPGVLFLHGFPGAEKNVDIQRALMERGVASFALHFAGAWGSEGEYWFSELVPQAKAALAWFSRQPFVDAKRLGVFGFSMGGWAALHLAAERPALKACAAVAPMGGPEMIAGFSRSWGERMSRPLRVRSIDELQADFARALRRRDPAAAVARRSCPLLLVHGTADAVVPAAVSRRLFELARPPKRLELARGAGHDFLDRRPWLTRLAAGWLAGRLR